MSGTEPQEGQNRQEDQFDREFLPVREDRFDSIAYIAQKILPLKQMLEQGFQKKHNTYLYQTLQAKINCYKKYESTSQEIKNSGRSYYECLQTVDDMIDNNYTKFANECIILRFQLKNCIDLCSGKSRTDQEFIQCAETSNNACFSRFQNQVIKKYKEMYRSVGVEGESNAGGKVGGEQNKGNE